ncbi:MAG: RNA pyrophosphohydrolase [Alphaproteobacteria bacterium]
MPKLEKKYRPCVGIALFNDDRQVFVGERIDTPGAWQMPQGGIDKGEDIEAAAYRELEEETGISHKNAKILKIAEQTICYDLPDYLIKKLWRGYYHGQEQTWIAMEFRGDDALINLRAHNPPEFSNWQWVGLHDTLDLIIPFKRDTYKKVIELFQDLHS